MTTSHGDASPLARLHAPLEAVERACPARRDASPRRLAGEIVGHDVSTVVREGWASLKNGDLLDAIETHFDVFITMDRNMRFQQRLAGRSFAVIEVHGLSTSIRALLPLAPDLVRCIDTIKPGEIQTVGEPRVEESDDKR